ncbi:DUF4328 domain-containing protein [Streptomyces sp. F-1]|uniref:DUF4328 domain-containing protein n=1 Tax=Streptomyces sp. F-1 TaxID=463642 RepID=UPI00085BFC6E|nr:DUF4328 domain-containing protein [Streptomyces sp. F-1]SFY50904.1 hypothetical protein STEPF1_04160 [Streptomyces sp. F-1]
MATPMPVPPVPAGPLGAPPPARLRSPAGLGLATAVLLGAAVAADLFACVADLGEMNVAQDLMGGATGADIVHRADRADTLYGSAGITQGVTLVATMVVYLCWLWRVRVNAEAFRPDGHRLKRGWVIGGWFCPIVNLWFPRRVVLDSWTASTPPGARVRRAPVNAWWTLWILGLLLGRPAATRFGDADTPAQLASAARLMLVSDGLDAAAGILAVVVVLHLTRMQRHRLLAAPAFG